MTTSENTTPTRSDTTATHDDAAGVDLAAEQDLGPDALDVPAEQDLGRKALDVPAEQDLDADLAADLEADADAEDDVDAIAVEHITPEDIAAQAPVVAHRSFADYGVQEQIVRALDEVDIVHPFPIQAMTLGVALSGHDIIGQAKTGTGKTLGFGIPLLQRVAGPGEPGVEALARPGAPQALVVVPTRELAVQVAGDLDAAGRHRAARVLTVYGGRAYEPQVEALRRGVEVVVGTPGRLLDLAQQGHLDLGSARCVVLDEADEMLDLGFLPDVERLLSLTPAGRQTMLFSATMPGAVVALARRYMTQPTHIRATDPDDDGSLTVKHVTQFAYRAHALDKVECLARILQARGRGLTIIFTRTKRTAAKVADDLAERGFAAAAIHGDLGQGAREQALRAFRNGKVDVLVATDVAARGIDVDNVTHVINYQCPEDEKTYLHRIGRTARAGLKGTAITFVDWDDMPRWGLVDRALGLGHPEPVETYSTSPHLHEDLDIPEGTKGVLPRAERTRAGLSAEQVEDLGETGAQRSRGGRSDGSRGAGAGRGDGAGRSGGSGRTGASGRSGGRRRSAEPDRPGSPAGETAVAAGEGTGAEQGAGEAAARRTRTRRRTRGGEPADAATADAATADATGGGAHGDAGVDSADADRSGDEAAPRRRRRRGGRGRSGAGGSAAGGELVAGGAGPDGAGAPAAGGAGG